MGRKRGKLRDTYIGVVKRHTEYLPKIHFRLGSPKKGYKVSKKDKRFG